MDYLTKLKKTYEVGETVVVIRTVWKTQDGRLVMLPMGFAHWLSDQLIDIDLRILTIRSHEKVCHVSDPLGPKEYDGYILQDIIDPEQHTLGLVTWYNQYPLSDVSLKDPKNQAFWNFVRSDELVGNLYYDVRHYLAQLNALLLRCKVRCESEKRTLIREHLQNVINTIEQKAKMEVKYDFDIRLPEDEGRISQIGVDILKFDLITKG